MRSVAPSDSFALGFTTMAAEGTSLTRTESCPHTELRQISTLTAETMWTLDGERYDPGLEPKILGEDTQSVECTDCGEEVGLGLLQERTL
jgi:hypothetical protein